jgi:hypothetical protein
VIRKAVQRLYRIILSGQQYYPIELKALEHPRQRPAVDLGQTVIAPDNSLSARQQMYVIDRFDETAWELFAMNVVMYHYR